jgi:xylulose-5-phosphate/fructose-6-phosphate phosphoketolase
VADHCLRSTNYVNVIVSDKQRHLQYLSMDEAIQHCTKGIGIWDWASNDEGSEPDVVIAAAGDVPTMEALAATAILREHFPSLRYVSSTLSICSDCSRRASTAWLSDSDSTACSQRQAHYSTFIYPWLIHARISAQRPQNLHVRLQGAGDIDTC